jgi:N-acetyl-anhydromuramyl-L-alanine amidase AmpD
MTQFIQARNYHRGRRKAIRLIVWHDMEAPQAHNTAENVAAWFGGPNAPQASAHVCCDDNSVVECVKPGDTAWHAPNANADGYGVELAGYRDEGAVAWTNAFSKAMFQQACKWLASLPDLKHIPDHWLTDAQLADGVTPGHTTHAQVTRVFGGGDHTDPGVGSPQSSDFPASLVMKYMVAARGGPQPTPKPVGDRWLRYSNPRLSGQDVKNVQHALNVAGNHIAEDGVYGMETAQLIAVFQKNRPEITERGVGPQTWKALRAVVHG